MKKVLAIDPGTNESAFLWWGQGRISDAAIVQNDVLLSNIRRLPDGEYRDTIVAIEMIACYGMPVGKEVFETCLLIGRMCESLERNSYPFRLVYRREIKLHHCMNARAKDSNIRQALIDKYGVPGTKKNPGPTYGMKSDLWSAFAIATYITETDRRS